MPVPNDPSPEFKDYAHPERLVSASWLSARLGSPGLRVVESDVRTRCSTTIGHVPGALPQLTGARNSTIPVIRDFIGPEDFAELMRSKGINRDDTVVIYGDKSNWWAAFTFWVFELFGHPDVRLLNGGRDAWIAEERDTSFAVPEYPRTTYPVPERDDARRAPFPRMFLTTLVRARFWIHAHQKNMWATARTSVAPRIPLLRAAGIFPQR